MREIIRKKIAPIYTLPGDVVTLQYTDEWGRTRVVAEHELTETRVFDVAIVAELDAAERLALGLSDGIAGIFGRESS